MLKVIPTKNNIVFNECRVEAKADAIILSGGKEGGNLATKYGLVTEIGEGVERIKVGDKILMNWNYAECIHKGTILQGLISEDYVLAVIVPE